MRTFDLVLTADWISPSVARDRLRSWLQAHRWSPAHVDDLVLAVNEAVSNSIEHGYGLRPEIPDPPNESALIGVHGEVVTEPDGSRRVELTIRDAGRWVVPGDGGNRGQGVRIMRACVEEVTVDTAAGGTTVVLRSWPVPAPLT